MASVVLSMFAPPMLDTRASPGVIASVHAGLFSF